MASSKFCNVTRTELPSLALEKHGVTVALQMPLSENQIPRNDNHPIQFLNVF